MNETLTLFEKDSTQPFSLNHEKCFETFSGETSLADKTSSSDLNASSISDESLPFDFSNILQKILPISKKGKPQLKAINFYN